MKRNSLLIELAKLRHLDKRIFVTENLLTRTFVFLLKTDRAVQRLYLKKLGIYKARGIDIRDQYYLDKKIPDIRIQINSPSVFALQENKIDSSEGKDQRKNYIKILQNNKARTKLFVYIERRRTNDVPPS